MLTTTMHDPDRATGVEDTVLTSTFVSTSVYTVSEKKGCERARRLTIIVLPSLELNKNGFLAMGTTRNARIWSRDHVLRLERRLCGEVCVGWLRSQIHTPGGIAGARKVPSRIVLDNSRCALSQT
jgi:hypothetical protein